MKTREEEKILEDLLSLPGARKANDGVILEHPDGIFHVRGVMKPPKDMPPEAHFFLEFCTENETRRILEIGNATDYLLKKRAEAIADNPRLVRQISQRKRAWTEAGRTWSLSHYYDTLNGPAKAYVRSLPKRDRKTLNAIAYGLAPLHQPNGLCFRSLVGDVVMVSDSLRSFFYFWHIASLGHFYGVDPDQQIHSLIIALRIMNGAEAPDFEMDPRERLPDTIRAKINTEVDWMMQFTFAHEFAHHALGHLDLGTDSLIDEIAFAHDLEYKADAYAITKLGRNSFRARKLESAAHQTFLAFHALEIVGKMRNDFPDFSVSKTHPTPRDRIAALCQLGIHRSSATPAVVTEAIEAIEHLVEIVLNSLEDDSTTLKFYGSVYLPGFDVGQLRDRIDY